MDTLFFSKSLFLNLELFYSSHNYEYYCENSANNTARTYKALALFLWTCNNRWPPKPAQLLYLPNNNTDTFNRVVVNRKYATVDEFSKNW